MPVTIRLRRGNESSLPTLAAGEAAFTLDTFKLFVGDGATNHEIAGGLVIGTDVQEWSAVLDAIAATAPVADGTYVTGARLTPGGTDGSVTYTNGIPTAIVQAT